MPFLCELAVLAWVSMAGSARASDAGAASFSAQGFGQSQRGVPARGAAPSTSSSTSSSGGGPGFVRDGGGGFDGRATLGGGGFDVQVAASGIPTVRPPASR